MRICERDKWKTVFETKYSYFEYQVIFFSLSHALANFQDYIIKILGTKLDVFIIIYLDDTLIYSNEADFIDSIW